MSLAAKADDDIRASKIAAISSRSRSITSWRTSPRISIPGFAPNAGGTNTLSNMTIMATTPSGRPTMPKSAPGANSG